MSLLAIIGAVGQNVSHILSKRHTVAYFLPHANIPPERYTDLFSLGSVVKLDLDYY